MNCVKLGVLGGHDKLITVLSLSMGFFKLFLPSHLSLFFLCQTPVKGRHLQTGTMNKCWVVLAFKLGQKAGGC